MLPSVAMLGALGGWLFALCLGVRHASEPDHVLAVSTLLAEHSRDRRGHVIGAIWGVGHAATLFVVGGSLLVLHLRMSARVASAFELAVAVMLLVLGARSIARAVRVGQRGRVMVHRHADHDHEHRGPSDHVHVGRWVVARKPLLVGLVHGLAGSGAIATLALANMPSLIAGLVYMLAFGAGSIVGMALLTGVGGWPLRQLATRPHAQVILNGAAGALSLALGFVWGWPIVRQWMMG